MAELPPGFVLEDAAPAAGAPALPPGFELEGQQAAPAAAPAQRSQWDLFKAGISAIAQDPKKLLEVGPLKGVREAVSLPGQAYEGQLPAYPSDYTPEQMDAAQGLAGMITPGAPSGLMPRGPGMARVAAEEAAAAARPPSPGQDMLARAAGLGIEGVPTFVASDSRATQALGQAARQNPLAGGIIEKAADKFTGSLERSAGEISAGLTPARGLDKAGLGEKVRTALESATENISEVNHRAFTSFKNRIEPTKPVKEALEPIQNVLADVVARRQQAGETGLGHLQPVANLLQREGGPSFEGLQRARSRIGKAIDFDARMGGGMEQGDLKQVYGALTEAMERAVRGSAKKDPEAAVSALRAANTAFAESTGNMRSLSQALKSPADEAIVNQVLGMAGEKTGNAKRLIQLQQDIGPENMRMLGSHVLDMAGGPKEWSATRFSTAMDKLSNTAKSVLFGDSRKAVEDLHAIAGRWAEQESKFANRSNTGRAATLVGGTGLLSAGLVTHPIATVASAAASAVAGVTLGHLLSRPATARLAVQTARAAERYAIDPILSSRNAFYALQRQLQTAVTREFGNRPATEPSSDTGALTPQM